MRKGRAHVGWLLAVCCLSGGVAFSAFGLEDTPWKDMLSRAREHIQAADYDEAARQAEVALTKAEALFGAMDRRVAESLVVLAAAHRERARYTEAEPLIERALKIAEHTSDDPAADAFLAETWQQLAELYQAQGRVAQAEEAARKAIALTEGNASDGSPPVRAASLRTLAEILRAAGNVHDAEPLLLRAEQMQRDLAGKAGRGALVSRENGSGELAAAGERVKTLNGLASLYVGRGQYSQADAFAQQAKELSESVNGHDHPQTGEAMANLGELARTAGNYEDAEQMYAQAREMWKAAYGEGHPKTASLMQSVARLRRGQGKYDESAELYEQALKHKEAVLGEDHPDIGKLLAELAGLYVLRGDKESAIAAYERAVQILQGAYGAGHPLVDDVIYRLVPLQESEGGAIMDPNDARYQRILARAAESLNRRAKVYTGLGEFAAAEDLFKQALEIAERSSGAEHPDVALVLQNYADLLRKIGRLKEARVLEARARKIMAAHPY